MILLFVTCLIISTPSFSNWDVQDRFPSNPKSNISVQEFLKNNSSKPLVYKGKKYEFSTKYLGEGLFNITFPGQYGSCLSIDMKPSHSRLKINSINTSRNNCSFNGNFSLEISEAIARYFSIVKIELIDVANVRCEKNSQDVNLAFLKIFQNGRTWYEKHGYQFDNHEQYRRNIHIFRMLNVNQILEENRIAVKKAFEKAKGEWILAARMIGRPRDVIAKTIQEQPYFKVPEALGSKNQANFIKDNLIPAYYEFKELKKSLENSPHIENYLHQYAREVGIAKSEILLHEFANWLWEKDCSYYTKSMNALFPNSNIDANYFRLRQKVKYSSAQATKFITCEEEIPSGVKIVHWNFD